MRTLSSLFRLRTGDRPNGVGRGRHVLLVCYRIRRCGAPPGLPFRPHRHSHNNRNHFNHRTRILLLSDLDVEQTVAVVMLDHRYRMYT